MKQTAKVNVTNFLAKQTPKFNKQPCAVRHTTGKTVLQWRKFKQCFALIMQLNLYIKNCKNKD